MALIEIDHVSKTYGTRDGGVVANDDVTLHVEEGVVSFPRDRAVDALTWAAELRGRRLVGDYSLREMSLEDTYVQLVGDREVGTDAH